MRFDKSESPDYVNEGNGWTEKAAADWMNAHDLVGDVLNEQGYIRYKVRPAGRFIGTRDVDGGVTVIQCEKFE